MRTYYVPEYGELAFHYANKGQWFAINDIMVPFPVTDYKGEYRVDGTLDWFRYYNGDLSKEGYPMDVALSDSLVTWETTPLGMSYPLQVRDLKNFKNFSYASEQQMEQRKWEFLANLVKINREIKGVELVEDDANYDSGQVLTIGAGSLTASTVWSSSLANPIYDVSVIKDGNKFLTNMSFNYKTLVYLMRNPIILQAWTGTGPDPDMTMPIGQQLAGLTKVLGLRCSCFMADAVTNSAAAPASQTKSTIWGNYVWFGRVDTESAPGNLQIPTWAHEFRFQPPGENYEGFIANRTVDERAGLHGMMHLDLGYDSQFKVYAKSYGAKIKGVY